MDGKGISGAGWWKVAPGCGGSGRVRFTPQESLEHPQKCPESPPPCAKPAGTCPGAPVRSSGWLKAIQEPRPEAELRDSLLKVGVVATVLFPSSLPWHYCAWFYAGLFDAGFAPRFVSWCESTVRPQECRNFALG